MEIETLAEIEINEIDKIGPKGLSAYEVYVKNGGTLSETEWLKSLRGEQGPQGKPGAVKMQVVDTLPDVGETDTIYLVKKNNPGEQNLYDEYVYANGSWEHIGDTSVDLTDYYTKEETDERLNNKQDTLTAGENITIENNVISAKDGALPLVVLPARSISDVSGNDQEGKRINILSLVKDQIEYAIDNFNGCCLLLFGGDDSSTNRAYTPYTYLLRPSFMYSKKQTRYEWQMTYTSTSIPLNSNELYGNKRIVISATGTWNGNKFTCTSCNYNRESAWSYLYINNTKPYTPINDYNPATKKYVDDNKVTKSGVLKYLEEENIYILTLDNNINSAASSISNGLNGTNNEEICGYFAEILNQVFPKQSGTLILNIINTGYSNNLLNNGVFRWDYGSRKFYTIGIDWFGCRINYLNITFNTNTDGTYNVTRVKLEYTPIKSSYTPTDNNHVVNKKYVDDLPKSYTGYDATKTQVLKNVNGTLTWVDEG